MHRIAGTVIHKAAAVLVVVVVVYGLPIVRSERVAAASSQAAAVGGETISFSAAGFEPLLPTRVLDTRIGVGAPQGPIGPASAVDLVVAGHGGVPRVGAGAVALNVTVVAPTVSTYVTAWPTGAPRPLASSLNAVPGDVVPNLVIAALGKGGAVALYNDTGATHLIADVVGWFPEGAGVTPLVPARVLDTRIGTGAPTGKVGPAGVLPLTVVGTGGVPDAGVGAVVLNVTVTEPSAASYVTVWPGDTPRPTASNLNMVAGQTVPNLVIAQVGTGGKIHLYNDTGATHLIADVVGWFPEAVGMTPLVPARVLDTRIGVGAPAGKLGPAGMLPLTAVGVGGVPASGVGTVVLNVTVTEPTATSYVTVWPGGSPRPIASSLNMVAGETVPNLVMAKVGLDGKVNIYNDTGAAHLIADVVGWFGDATAGGGSMTLRSGTVLAGPSDVVRSEPGTVVLTASADVPVVGDHLAVSGSGNGGALGRVTAIIPGPDGTTVTLADAIVEDAFGSLKQSYDGPLPDIGGETAAARLGARTAAAAGPKNLLASCKRTDGVTVSLGLTLNGLGLKTNFDLNDRRLLFDLKGTATVKLSAEMSAGFTCTVELPPIPIPLGPVTLELTPSASISVGGKVSASASASAPLRVGVDVRGSQVTNLSSVSFTGTASMDAEADVSVTLRPGLKTDVKLFGIAGLTADFGVALTAKVTLHSNPCAKVTLRPSIGLGFEVGRWGLTWSVTLAEIEFGVFLLYEEEENCPVPAPFRGRLNVGDPPLPVSFSGAGQVADLTFGGTAGATKAIQISGFGVYYDLHVLAPDETYVIRGWCPCNGDGFSGPILLNQTGTYHLIVDPNDANVLGGTVQLYDVPPPFEGRLDVGDPPLAVAFSGPGQTADVEFGGTAGVVKAIQIAGFGTYYSLHLVAPDGSYVFTDWCPCNGHGFSEPITMPQTGTYHLLIDPNGPNVNGGTVELSNVPSKFEGRLEVGGPPFVVTFSGPGQTADLEFGGSAGATRAIQISGFGTYYRLDLLAPDGTHVFTDWCPCNGDGFSGELLMPLTGTYHLLIDPNGPKVNGGTVQLTSGSRPS